MLAGLFGLIILAAGGVMVLVGLTYLKAYVRIARTDPTDVAAVRAGTDEVALSGTARPAGGVHTSPLEGEESLMTEWKVRERRSNGRGGTSMMTLASGHEAERFVLDDGTGEVLVDPSGSEWMFEEHTHRTDGSTPPPAAAEDTFRDRNITPNVEKGASARDRTLSERRLDPGEPVYVYGPVKPGPAEDAPADVISPYVGTDAEMGRGVTEKTTMQLRPEVLPFVGDSEATLSLGGADETALFTVADADPAGARRQYLKRGLIVLVFGLFFFGFGAGVVYLS